jgi:hypothetical protein
MSDDYKSPEAQQAFARAQMDEAQRRGELAEVDRAVNYGCDGPGGSFMGVRQAVEAHAGPTEMRRAGVLPAIDGALRSGDVEAQREIRFFRVPNARPEGSEYENTSVPDTTTVVRLSGEPAPPNALSVKTLADARAERAERFKELYGEVERARTFLGGSQPYEPSGPAASARMDADDQAFAAEAALDHFTRARLGELPRGASDLPIAAVHIADETMQAIQTAIESGEIKQLAELSLHTILPFAPG